MTFDRESGVYEALRKDLRKFTPLSVREVRRAGVAPVPSSQTPPSSAAGPTVIVAASDASDFSKAIANYEADGTDDDQTIEEAMDDIETDTGTVILTEGTFTLGAAINFNPHVGVSVIGQGPGSTTLVKANSNNDNIFTLSSSSSRNRIAGMELDGNKANCTSGSGISNSGDYQVYEDLYIHDFDTNAFTGASTESWVWLNRIHASGCAADGIEPAGTDVWVTDCFVESSGFRDFIIAAQRATVTNCQSKNAGTEGFRFSGTYIQASDCLSLTPTTIGFYVLGTPVQLANCLAVGTGTNGYTVSGTYSMLDNCRAYQPDQYGFWVDGNYSVLSNCLAYQPSQQTNNTYDGFYAQQIASGTRADFRNCHVVGKSAANQPRYGFNIASTANNVAYLGCRTGPSSDYGTGTYNDAGTGTINTWPGAAAPQGDNLV